VSDTVLERFGHPPGGKIPQKRHQEQNLKKNGQILGVPWAPKWTNNSKKNLLKKCYDFLSDIRTTFSHSWVDVPTKKLSKMRGLGITFSTLLRIGEKCDFEQHS